MDRFFSKLDLRDIKIDPEAKFPPTDDTCVETEDAVEPVWNGGDDIASAVLDPEADVVDVTPLNGETNGLKAPHRNGEVLKVSARSRPSAVAGAIAGVVRESGRAEVQAIGAGATNQAVKAVAIARDYLLETGIEAVCLPAFIDVTIDNEERTAIRMIVEPR